MNPKKLLVLAGPTAVGKTAISLRIAKKLGCEIVSADSMQIYKYMDVGTAKIMPDEMQNISHHMIDIISPGDAFDVYQYQKQASDAIESIYSRGKIPLLTGGTGFYIQALLYDVNFTSESADKSYREELQKIAQGKAPEQLYQKLMEIDPEYAKTVHPNNYKRIIRALDYNHNTGEKFSVHNEEQKMRTSPYNFKYYVLNMDRKKLYENIEKRVDIMFEKGLVDEVESLLEMGYDRNLTAMQAIGYKEFFEYIDEHCVSANLTPKNSDILHDNAACSAASGNILETSSDILKNIDIEHIKNQIKINTRHYAKRQLTWFRRERDAEFIDKDQFDNDDQIADYIIEQFTKETSDNE